MTAALRKRLERRLVRRFGASSRPLAVYQTGENAWRVIDRETGSRIEARLVGKRQRSSQPWRGRVKSPGRLYRGFSPRRQLRLRAS